MLPKTGHPIRHHGQFVELAIEMTDPPALQPDTVARPSLLTVPIKNELQTCRYDRTSVEGVGQMLVSDWQEKL